MSKQLEHSLHCAFHDWYVLNPRIAKYMFCVEHGEARDARVGAKLKRKGVRKGMADYYYMRPNVLYNSLWIEFKVGKNTQSLSQIEFQDLAEECKAKYVVCYTLDEAIAVLKDYSPDLFYG